MTYRTRIKFCGMTSLADAQLAANLGVDAIGLIFHSPSPRNVTLNQAYQIASNLPPFVSRVGVLVNESYDTIQSILHSVPLDMLQFHGQETAEFCRGFNKPYIKVIQVTGPITQDYEQLYPDAIGLLFDTGHTHLAGGTGTIFDWQLIPAQLTKPIIIAGGLTIDNIHTMLTQVRPYAVDVTSGIEQVKGVKDPGKMQEFVARVANISNNRQP